jgi:hypothetical protein
MNPTGRTQDSGAALSPGMSLSLFLLIPFIFYPVFSTIAYDDMRRAIRARMDTETVKSVVQMGYPKEIVRSVIEQRLRNTGCDAHHRRCFHC